MQLVTRAELSTGEYHRRDTCRVCGSRQLSSFLDYGLVPLAGDFVLADDVGREKLYPLDLVLCQDCSLVQVLNVVSADEIFDDYRYLSSITQTLTKHFEAYAGHLRDYLSQSERKLVVDIGCNDGVLLQPLKRLGIPAIGVDAAENIVQIAREKGLDVRHHFFGTEIARQIRATHGPAAVITASNVFAHIDNLDSVMNGVVDLLAPDGTFIVEVHYILDLLATVQFDTVYHEHLCYYSLHALARLYDRFDLCITHVERLPMHGGAARVFAQRKSRAQGRCAPIVRELMHLEMETEICSLETYRAFAEKTFEYRDAILALVDECKSSGRKVSGYGAAGRATILLNFCQLGRDCLDYVVDESPSRVGRFIPGVQIPIVPRSHFVAHPPDDCLLTAWNYQSEIVAKEQKYLSDGGRFLVPLPKAKIIEERVRCRKSA